MLQSRSKSWDYVTAIGLAIALPVAGLLFQLMQPESALREVFDRGGIAASGRYIQAYLIVFAVPLTVLFCLVTAIWRVFSSHARARKQAAR